VNGPSLAIRDRHSLGHTHSLQVPLCLVMKEWSRLRNQDNYSSLLENNSPDSSSLMLDFLRVDALPNLTNVSGRMSEIIQFIS
jgi:hypothetical protein